MRKTSFLQYTPSIGNVGWLKVFRIPRQYNILSFTLHIQRTAVSGSPLCADIDVMLGTNMYNPRINIRRITNYTMSSIQVCKIRLVHYATDPNYLYLHAYLGKPNGQEALTDDTNSIYITISNLVSLNYGSKILYDSINTYNAGSGNISVPENPENVNIIHTFDIINSSIIPNIVRINKEVQNVFNSLYFKVLSSDIPNPVIFAYVYAEGNVHELFTIFCNYAYATCKCLNKEESSLFGDIIFDPYNNDTKTFLIKLKKPESFTSFNFISYHNLQVSLHNYEEPESEP